MQPLIAFVAGGYSVPPGTLTVPRPDAECERLSDEPRGAFIRADRAGRRLGIPSTARGFTRAPSRSPLERRSVEA